MVQEKVKGLQVSQAGGGPPVKCKADVFSRCAGGQCTACRVHEAFKGSSECLTGMVGGFFCPGGMGVGKGSVEDREQTIKALQSFALTFRSHAPSSHWQGTHSSQGHRAGCWPCPRAACESHAPLALCLRAELCAWRLVYVSPEPTDTTGVVNGNDL